MFNEEELYMEIVRLNKLHDELEEVSERESEKEHYQKFGVYSPLFLKYFKQYRRKIEEINGKLHFFEVEHDDEYGRKHHLVLKSSEGDSNVSMEKDRSAKPSN